MCARRMHIYMRGGTQPRSSHASVCPNPGIRWQCSSALLATVECKGVCPSRRTSLHTCRTSCCTLHMPSTDHARRPLPTPLPLSLSVPPPTHTPHTHTHTRYNRTQAHHRRRLPQSPMERESAPRFGGPGVGGSKRHHQSIPWHAPLTHEIEGLLSRAFFFFKGTYNTE